jgi:hypothetical protein
VTKRTFAVLNRKAWAWFFVAAVLAAGWFGLNLLRPNLAVGPVHVRLLFILAWNAVFLYGLWRSLTRADFSPTARAAAWLGTAALLAGWIAAVWVLAAKGIFQLSLGKVPSLPLAIVIPVVLGTFVLTRWQAVALLLDATPPSWLIALQVYRILGATFLVYWIRGAMPAAFALPAGIGDVATGLLALPAASWVASGFPIGRRIGIRWNFFGLMDFAVAVTMGMLTSPGPAQLLAREHPNTLIATFPAAIIPAFVVPFSILLHVLSLRQLKRSAGKSVAAASGYGELVTGRALELETGRGERREPNAGTLITK